MEPAGLYSLCMLRCSKVVFIGLMLFISFATLILRQTGQVASKQNLKIFTMFSQIRPQCKSCQNQSVTVKPFQIAQHQPSSRSNSWSNSTSSILHQPGSTKSQLTIQVAPAAEKLCGLTRLGNKLFMIAAAYTAAQRSGAKFVLPDCKWSRDLQNTFPALQNFPLIPPKITDTWENLTEFGFTFYTPLKITHNSSIDGYRQSWKYFRELDERAQLHTLFKLNNPLVKSAHRVKNELLHSVGLRNATTVGVHIRLGDLLLEHNKINGYRAPGIEFYREAFRITSEFVGPYKQYGLVFVVASDSVSLAQNMLIPLNDSYKIVVTNQQELVDFTILSLCDHSVISGGTYSFWSALLAGGHVVYNDHYIEPGTKIAEGYDSRSFHLPEWTPL